MLGKDTHASLDAHELTAAFPGVLIVVDRDLRIEFAGGDGLAVAGWDPAAIIDRRLADVLPAEAAARLLPEYRRALAGERPVFDLVGKRTWAVHMFPRRDEGGAITGAFAVVHDVTGERREERVLADQMELAFRQAPTGIALVRLDGVVLQANPALCALLGYDADELRGKSIADVTHPDDLAADLANVERLLAGEVASYSMEKRYLVRGGDVVWANLTVGLVRDPAGEPSHFVAQVEDVSERRRVEEQLRETQRLESLGLLAGGVAHDFNNLLVGVLGNASLALLELPPDSPARRRLESIQLAAQRAGALTRQMLAYSGRGAFAHERIDLSREAAELRELLASAVSEQAEIRLDLAHGLPPIEGDPSQVRQVVMNLITNASEALDGPGVVLVKTGVVRADRAYLADFRLADALPEGEYVFLEVSDTGVGMDAETCAKIFDPFFTTKFTGRGLGLAAVRGIVRGHGGALKVYTEPGSGSSFKVLFPSAEPSERDAGQAVGGTGTVLVADDEPIVREVAAAVLVDAGYQVLTASSGAEAVRVLTERTDEVALVLLDLTMPGQGTEDTVERLRALRPGLPVLLTSGYNEQILGERLARTGSTGFIQKPYAAAELVELVDRTLSA